MSEQSRRKFIKHIGSTAALLGIGQLAAMAKEPEHVQLLTPEKRVSPTIKFALPA